MPPFILVTFICPRYWSWPMQAPRASQPSLRSFKLTTALWGGRQIKSLALQMRGVEPLLRKRKAFKADLRKPAARERAEALPAGPTLGLTSLKWPRILEGQVLCWPFLHPSSWALSLPRQHTLSWACFPISLCVCVCVIIIHRKL